VQKHWVKASDRQLQVEDLQEFAVGYLKQQVFQ
jgi:hypothetical protein